MNFYLSEVPFSRFGSYMALAELPDWWQGHKIEHGIYLKNVSGCLSFREISNVIFASPTPKRLLFAGADPLY